MNWNKRASNLLTKLVFWPKKNREESMTQCKMILMWRKWKLKLLGIGEFNSYCFFRIALKITTVFKFVNVNSHSPRKILGLIYITFVMPSKSHFRTETIHALSQIRQPRLSLYSQCRVFQSSTFPPCIYVISISPRSVVNILFHSRIFVDPKTSEVSFKNLVIRATTCNERCFEMHSLWAVLSF